MVAVRRTEWGNIFPFLNDPAISTGEWQAGSDPAYERHRERAREWGQLGVELWGMTKRRYEISDAQWERIAPLLPGKATDRGVTARDNRLFLTPLSGCCVPARRGPICPSALARSIPCANASGAWQAVFEALQGPYLDWVMLDPTVVRAHQHAAGQKKYARSGGHWAQSRRDDDENSRLYRRTGQRPSVAGERRPSGRCAPVYGPAGGLEAEDGNCRYQLRQRYQPGLLCSRAN